MIVVDATVWVDRLLGVLPEHLSSRIREEGAISPPHVDFEVGGALLRLERRGRLPAGAARELVVAFSGHPVERVRHADDAAGATAFVDNATYAEAWYIALAQRLELGLMTLDGGMRSTAQIHGIDVIGVG